MTSKLIICLIIVLSQPIFSQEKEESVFLSSLKVGFYGGINFKSLSEIGSSLIIEGKTSLTSNLDLKISIGYSRTYMPVSYHVNTYANRSIQGTNIWEAISYDVNKKGYDIIPFSIGLQYFITESIISPYLLSEFSYNSIATKVYKSSELHRQFYSFDELPDEYKIKHAETIINSSSKFGIGMGATYRLTGALDLDIRYIYQFDNTIINTNQILVGIFF